MLQTLKWASVGVGLLPGVTVLLSGTGSPPGLSGLFGGIIETFSAVALVLVWLNRGKLRNARRSLVTRATIALGAVALLLFVGYTLLFRYCVISLADRSPVYFPLVACESLATEIDLAGGSRAALVEAWGSRQAQELAEKCPDMQRSLTTVVLLKVYALAFVVLTCALAIPAAASRTSPSP